MSTDALLTLHQMFSPSFPVGAFAWSHGLETAIQSGEVADAASLQDWLEDVMRYGAGWSDAVLLCAAARGEEEAADLALALSPSAERRAETREQGAAFARTVRAVWHVKAADAAYPIAVGQTAAALQLPLGDTVRIYLQAFAANLAMAGVRLIPLGQTEGQQLTQALIPLCAALAGKAMDADLQELGGFCPAIDIHSQRHEALYSRVFRS